MTDKNKIVIIGGGHNGLICAAYLAKAGKQVTVLEASDQLGGAAITREFAPGFKVSAGAHLLYLLDKDVRKELALDAHGLQMAQKAMSTIALAEDGKHLTFSYRIDTIRTKLFKPRALMYSYTYLGVYSCGLKEKRWEQ